MDSQGYVATLSTKLICPVYGEAFALSTSLLSLFVLFRCELHNPALKFFFY